MDIEPGLIIRGVAAALDDDNVLVRRNGLDLLVRVLKIHETLFTPVSSLRFPGSQLTSNAGRRLEMTGRC